MNQKEQPSQQDIEEIIKSSDSLIEYMLLVGIPEQQVFRILKNGYMREQRYKPQVLCRFPEVEKYQCPLDEKIPQFCFPLGFRMIDDFISNSEQFRNVPYLFDFVLTNEKGERIYVSCMHIYQSVHLYKKARRNLFNEIEKAKKRKTLQDDKNIDTIESPQLLASKSANPERLAHSPIRTKLPDAKSSPAIRDMDGNKVQSEESKEYVLNDLYVPKCLCLVSRYPFFDTYRRILLSLSKLLQVAVPQPIESYILNIVIGILKVVLKLPFEDTQIYIKQPAINELPYVNEYFFHQLFTSLPLNNIITLFSSLLVERPIVIISQKIKKLTYVCEALLSLLFPFQYELVYIPILPIGLIDFLYTPVPYLIGVHHMISREVYSRVPVGTCVLHLEKREIKFQNESTEVFNPNAGDSDYFSQSATDGKEFIPEYQHEKLRANVGRIMKQSVGENGKRQFTPKMIKETRQYFFKFFISLLYKYRKAIKLDPEQKVNWDSPSDHFDKEKFLGECCRVEARPFLSQFVETNLFKQFIVKKINPMSQTDYYTTLYFDQHADMKQFVENGGDQNEKDKLSIPFLSDKSQRQKEKFTVVEREEIENSLASLVSHYIKTSENKETLLLPLDMRISKNNSYKYFLFPLFLGNLFPPKREYDVRRLPEDQMQKLDQDGIVRSKLPQKLKAQKSHKIRLTTLKRSKQAECCIYICWIAIWSSVLHGQDEEEVPFRTEQLMELLEYMVNHSYKPALELLQLIMELAYKNGNHYIILKIFNLMNRSQYQPNAGIINLVLKTLSRNKSMTKVYKFPNRMKRDVEPFKKSDPLPKSRFIPKSRGSDSPTTSTKNSSNDSTSLRSQVKTTKFIVEPRGKGQFRLMKESQEGEREDFDGFQEEKQNDGVSEGYESDTQSDTLSSRSNSSIKTSSSNSYGQMQIGIEGVLAPKSLIGKSAYYINKVKDFRKRTFKFQNEMHYFTDEVRITVEHICKECGKYLDVQGIKKSYEIEQNASSSDQVTPMGCLYCTSEIKPRMNVIVGRKMHGVNEENIYHTQEDVEFYSPQELRQNLEQLLTAFNFTLELQNFRRQAPCIFWNLVWHFKQFQLPYDFMLAYEEKPFMKEFEALNSHLTVSTNEERMEESKDVDPDELRVFERNRSGTSEDI